MLIDIMKRIVRVSQSVTEDRLAVKDASKEFVHQSEMFRGRHEVLYDACTGCDACNKICPVDAIIMKPLPLKRPNKIPEVSLSICIFCGLCEDVCPTKPKAIKLSGGDFDMRAGGLHEDQNDFWVKVDVPEEWIEKKKEEEKKKAEAAAKKKAEMAAKKKAEAEAKAKAEAEAKAKAEAEAKESESPKEENNG
jgi:NADH-quinone oxidoreductase subunit I